MPEPITLAHLQRPNGLLIGFDHMERHRARLALLERFEDRDLADAFHLHAGDTVARALLELRLLGGTPFEAFAQLRRLTYATVAPHPFRTLVANAHGTAFWDVAFGERIHRRPRRRHRRPEAELVLGGAVRGYLVRHTGQGVVLGRALLEQALDLADMELLALAVDPRDGAPLLERVPPDAPLWSAEPPEDLQAARCARLEWWAPSTERSVWVHDLAPTPEPAPAPASPAAAPGRETPAGFAAQSSPTPQDAGEELRALRALRDGIATLLRGVGSSGGPHGAGDAR